MRSAKIVLVAPLAMLAATHAARAQAPGAPEWNRMQNESARDRVRLDAFQRAHSGAGPAGAGGATSSPPAGRSSRSR